MPVPPPMASRANRVRFDIQVGRNVKKTIVIIGIDAFSPNPCISK